MSRANVLSARIDTRRCYIEDHGGHTHYSTLETAALLFSGLLCDETVWSDIPERLAGYCRCARYLVPRILSISAMAEHVLACAPQRFALAGHSMGGRVALEVMRWHGCVSGLALLNTGVHAVRDGEPQSRSRLLRLAYEQRHVGTRRRMAAADDGRRPRTAGSCRD